MIPVIPVSRKSLLRLRSNFSLIIPIITGIAYFRQKQNDMRLSHPDYIKLVIETYKSKRAKNELSNLLVHPTYSKIKKECLAVYKKRYEKKDEKALSSFFGPEENGKSFLQLMKAAHADKFKPLNNYLGGKTEKTDDKNIELLAWLIDFQHRPYVFDRNVLLSEEELSFLDQFANNAEKTGQDLAVDGEGLKKRTEEPGNDLKNEPDEQTGEAFKEPSVLKSDVTKSNSSKKKPERILIIILILVICTAGIYAVWKEKQGNAVCGYWAGDRYKEVPCNEDPQGRIILTMNREKIQRFRKITRKDTITQWSIGKVYYVKNSDTLDCYTEGGKYPENINRSLKVLSRHMFDKYLNKKPIAARDSIAD